MKRSASLRVGDPQLAPAQHELAAVVACARLKREGVAPGLGLRERVRAHTGRRQAGQKRLGDFWSAPTQYRVDDERVLDVDEDADRGIDARQLLDGEDRVKEAAAGAAERLGDLDPHDAERKQLLDERPRQRGAGVHLGDQRLHGIPGELTDGLAKELLVLAEAGQRARLRARVGHAPDVIIGFCVRDLLG